MTVPTITQTAPSEKSLDLGSTDDGNDENKDKENKTTQVRSNLLYCMKVSLLSSKYIFRGILISIFFNSTAKPRNFYAIK